MSTERLLQAIGEAVILTDPTGHILFWNKAAEALYGWSAEEATGRHIFDTVPLAGPPGEVAAIAAHLGAGGRWSGEALVRRRDGSTFLSLATSTPVFDDDGNLTAVIGVGRDISALGRSERSLATSRHRFQALIEGAGDLFAVTDEAGVIQTLDGPVETHFGVAAEALVGTSLFDLVASNDIDRAQQRWAEQLRSATPLAAEDYWTRRADGTWLCLNLIVNNLLDDPAVAGLAVTARDITERKHLERARVATAGSNSALVHATSEDGLYNEICRVVQDQTVYHLAWVGLRDPTRALGVRMVAFADHSAAYVEALELLAGNDTYSGPLVQAIESREVVVVQDIEALPVATSWRALALDFGYRAMIALPLVFSDDDCGVLAIYSEEPRAFNDDTVRVLSELAGDLAFGVDALRTQAERAEYRGRFEASLEAAVRAIATAAELRDPYTAGHQHRVAELASAIATDLGLSADDVTGIGTAASIHDIGKLLVPAEILSKPGRLTDAEFAIIKQHAQAGRDIVAGIDFPWPVADMILQHHERLDGSGYPNNLMAEDILPGSRIIAVADVVEAMQSHRPYRPGLGIDVALAQIERDRGKLLDADAVDSCLRLFREQGFAFEV